MALYRQIHTCFWDDDKVMDEMDLEEKFFYLYLLTNQRVKQCGCYDISWKKTVLETTLSKEKIEDMLEKFENEYKLIKYNKKTKEILLLNFYKYNWTLSPKVKSCVESELKEIKDSSFIEYIKKMIGYKYGIDTLCIGLGEEEKNKNKNKNKNKSERELSQSGKATPTLADIISYGSEIGASEEYCERFYDTYESVGWVNANGIEIKNWKAVLRNWFKKDLEKGNTKDTRKKDIDPDRVLMDENGKCYKENYDGTRYYI